MNIQIRNEKDLKATKEFVDFLKGHQEGYRKSQELKDVDMYEINVRQSEIMQSLAKGIRDRQKALDDAIAEIKELKQSVRDLERELRVSRDLLTIGNAIKDGQC